MTPVTSGTNLTGPGERWYEEKHASSADDLKERLRARAGCNPHMVGSLNSFAWLFGSSDGDVAPKRMAPMPDAPWCAGVGVIFAQLKLSSPKRMVLDLGI